MSIFVCNTNPDSGPGDAWDAYRAGFDRLSELNDDWQGVPVHLADHPLRLNDRHHLADAYRELDGVGLDILVGGPTLAEDEDEECVNRWYSRARNADIYIFHRKPSGRAFSLVAPRSPDGSMARLDLWLQTMGASDAWSLDAEYQAREKLYGLLNPLQWRTYDLTGAFVESSRRSGLTYVFRRLRPTVALSPRWPWFRTQHDTMRTLAVLCMHPIGYYEKTWAGCLVPTDDVIAHLLFMRGDEAGFWKEANQHEPAQPEAGL